MVKLACVITRLQIITLLVSMVSGSGAFYQYFTVINELELVGPRVGWSDIKAAIRYKSN